MYTYIMSHNNVGVYRYIKKKKKLIFVQLPNYTVINQTFIFETFNFS